MNSVSSSSFPPSFTVPQKLSVDRRRTIFYLQFSVSATVCLPSEMKKKKKLIVADVVRWWPSVNILEVFHQSRYESGISHEGRESLSPSSSLTLRLSTDSEQPVQFSFNYFPLRKIRDRFLICFFFFENLKFVFGSRERSRFFLGDDIVKILGNHAVILQDQLQ